MDQKGAPTQSQRLEGFKPLLILTEILGLLSVVLVIIWVTYYKGGFAWRSNPKIEFNWHPVLMIIGFVFLYANAMLLFRTQRNLQKKQLKLMHGGLALTIIILVIIALIAAFDSHNLAATPIPNLYTLHSWVGLTTVILFCCQWIGGCISFLYPGVRDSLRGSYMPIHVYFGTAGFIGVIISCLLGFTESAIWHIKGYNKFVSEGILINCLGLVLVVFGGLTVYLVTREQYKRLPEPVDNIVPMDRYNHD